MQREIKITSDGSPTLFVPELNEHYHSKHGAYTESLHVFIKAGLILKQQENINKISILEIGLGTGLNVLLTEKFAANNLIQYEALEPYPLEDEIINALLKFDFSPFKLNTSTLEKIHRTPFNQEIQFNNHFSFNKIQSTLEKYSSNKKFDLIYFDAFGPQVQLEIWSENNFRKLFEMMHPYAILVTYSAKGDVRRAMQGAGFSVERIPGPPGKREMLRATKK